MKITAITEQVKTKGRYSVYVDKKFAFGISELGLINYALRVGMEFTEQELSDMAEKAELDKLYNMAVGLIARRPRSLWEIDTYLKRKNIDEPSRKNIIQDLADRRLLNDHDFAERWVENRRLLKSISYRKLRIELMQKRVNDQIINEVLAGDSTSELDVLREEVVKKRRQSRYQDNTKLMQYLARQGYSYEDIKRAMADTDLEATD